MRIGPGTPAVHIHPSSTIPTLHLPPLVAPFSTSVYTLRPHPLDPTLFERYRSSKRAMIWRCTLLLALCAFSNVRCMVYPRIEYRYGGGPGQWPCTAQCYKMIQQWFMEQGCVLPYGIGSGTGGPGGNYYGTGGPGGTGGPSGTGGWYTPYPTTTTRRYDQDLYIDFYNSYGQIESLPVSGPCFAFQLCQKCGENGQCVVEDYYSQPKCKCKEGYEGEKCDKKVTPETNTVIVVVTVIAGLLAFFIIVAIIVHICWKHKGPQKPNHVHVSPGHHCGPPVNHCGPVVAPCSQGHPSMKGGCNVPLRIHAATPMGHQHHFPPVIGGHGQYCPPHHPPRSTVKITEIVEDPPYSTGGAVVPAGGGLFGNGTPHQQQAIHNVYTTIGAAPPGHGTTISLG